MKLPHVTLPALALFLGFGGAASGADKPNIIFVISDDHRWDCIGASGNPNIHTPSLDRLATEGVHFIEGTIHIPQCSPSRAALITGLAGHTNGRYSNQSARADVQNPHGFDDYLCTPEALAAEGYATALVGKWHLAPDPWNVGFQQVGTWMPAGAGAFKNAPLAQGKSRETKPNPKFTQQAFGDSAEEIIRNHADTKSTQPLFLWMAFTAPHSPYKPNPDAAIKPYKDKETKDVIPPPSTYEASLENNSDAKHWLDYVAAISSVDLEIERLLKTLDDTDMSSNTVIVFLGDNGYMMGVKDWHGKVVPWEDSVRVPFIVWGPGVFKAKGKTQAVASSLDLPVTFLKLAGAEPPKEWHGRDLTPVLEDGQPHDITWSVSEFADYDNWKFPGISYRTVRTTGSKLIVWHESTGKAPEFYNIAKDPEEKNNLYSDPAAKSEVARLEGLLSDWMKKTNDDWSMRGKLEQTEGPKEGGKKGKKAEKKAAREAADDDE